MGSTDQIGLLFTWDHSRTVSEIDSKSNVTPLVSYGYPNLRVTVMIQFSLLLPTRTPP